jgi:hypothetical protein
MTGSASVPIGVGGVAGHGAGEDEVAERVDLGLPAGLDDGGGGGVDDEGGAGDDGAGGEGGAVEHLILPARSGGRGTRRSLVEGYVAQACSSYPSTTLRVVPLPI